MPIDYKYGRVTLEHGDHIPEDEPVVVFRARDINLPKLLMYYHLFCLKMGSPKRHLDLIFESIRKIKQWQERNPDAVQVPTSETSKAWMD